jgi:hypothetical protein
MMASSEACPRCDGTGKIKDKWWEPGDLGDGYDMCGDCNGTGKKPSVCPTCGYRSRRGSFSNSADSIAPAGLCRDPFHSPTRDLEAETEQIAEILNRPHEPRYECQQCGKSPEEHGQAPTDPMPGSEITKGPTITYIRGLGRDYPVPKRSHLYFGNFDYVGDPLCCYGWNRADDEGDGSGYSIWRGNTGKLGICKICLRRAKREGLIEWQPAYKGHQPNGRD